MPLFKRQRSVRCYFCQTNVASSASPSVATFGASSSSLSFDPNQFRCPHCGCWNRYNSRGEIVGDEPAMHDERLNTDSFSKRGSPNRNHLPSVHRSSNTRFFCHTCQTNQTLLVNLLSNYLPSPDDPLYDSRVAALPDYTASLQLRYPPVCSSCLPAVDEEINRKDEMARTRALAGALKASNPRAALGKNNIAKLEKKADLRSWRTRGVLWATNLSAVLVGYTAAALNYRISPRFEWCAALCPPVALLSLIWVFWDPTYSLQRHSTTQGRKVRVEGRKTYIFLQGIACLSRLITSAVLFSRWWTNDRGSLVIEYRNSVCLTLKQLFLVSLTLELSVLLFSYFSITIHRPAAIRLIDTSASRGLAPYLESAPQSSQSATFSRVQSPVPSAPLPPSSQALPEPDLFATLSLSSNPIITNYATTFAANPMFGRPSLNSQPFEPSSNYSQRLHVGFVNPPSRASRTDLLDHNNGIGEFGSIRDSDAMDWEPLSPKGNCSQNNIARVQDDGSWLRQQRFFPPEEPTGLEGLLMRTRLMDDDDARVVNSSNAQNQALKFKWHWGWVYSVSAFPIFILVVALWINTNTGTL